MVGLGTTGELAGWLHDMGKCKDEFRDYLIQSLRGEKVRRGQVNHTFAGVKYLLDHYHSDPVNNGAEYHASEILAYAIGAHHGGFDIRGPSPENGFDHRILSGDFGYEESIETYFKECKTENELSMYFKKSAGELRNAIGIDNAMVDWNGKAPD